MGVPDEWSYSCFAVDRTRLTGQLTLFPAVNNPFLFMVKIFIDAHEKAQ